MSDDTKGIATEDAAPASPADSLRLIRAQQAATARSLIPDARLLYWPWGFAWLIGFGLLFLRFGPDERSYWNIPGWTPLAVLYALITVALVLTTATSVRANRHVRGRSSRQGLMYGLSWFGAYASVAAIAGHFSDQLAGSETGLLWASLSVAVVGVLYLAGAAIWPAPEMFVLGTWLTVCNIAGVIAGAGWHSLVIAIAGGGGMLVMGLVAWLRRPLAKAQPTA